MKAQNREILIVGAGPTGLTLACELLRRGISCRIIDKNKTPTLHSKALGISSTSLLIFERLGIANIFINAGIKMYDTYVLWKKKRLMHINYKYLRNTTKYPFMLLIQQTETERYLAECLENLGGKIERGVELKKLTQNQDGVMVELFHHSNEIQEQTVYSEVIGCDGSQSSVRKLLNIAFDGEDYGLNFIYADVELENWRGNPSNAYYYVDGSSLLIIIPTPNNIYRVVGLISGDKTVSSVPILKEMQTYVDQFGLAVILKNPTQFGSVPLYYRLAEKNRVGQVYLAGDAVHLFSPLGGQGMNTGIQDAYNLAWKLAYVKKGLARFILLDSYETERLFLVRNLIGDIGKIIALLLQKDKEKNQWVKMHAPVLSNRKTIRDMLPKNYSGFNYQYADCYGYTKDYHTMHTESEHAIILYLNNNDNGPNSECEYAKKIKKLISSYPFIHTYFRHTESVSYFYLVRPDAYVAHQDLLHNTSGLQNYLEKFYIKQVCHVS